MAQEKKMARREKGEGSIYPIDGGKRFGAAIYYVDETGTKKRKVITKKTEALVKKAMTEFLIQHGLMDIPDSVVIDSLTLVCDVVEEFKSIYLINSLESGEITARTYKDDYVPALNKFVKAFGNKPVGDITTNELMIFYKNLSMKYSQSSLDKVYMMVTRLFDRAYKKGYIKTNPTDDMDYRKPKSKIEKQKVSALSHKEIMKLKEILKDNIMLYAPVLLMMDTGARIQEILGLRWDCIDFETGEIKIDKAVTIHYDLNETDEKKQEGEKKHRDKGVSKTILSDPKTQGSKRVVFVGEETLGILKDWKEFAEGTHKWKNGVEVKNTKTKLGHDDFIFGNTKHASWTVNGFRSSINNFIAQQSKTMGGLAFHRIRHFVATLLGEQEDVTLIELMQQLGHVNPKTTMRYIDESRKMKMKTGQKIAKLNYEKEKRVG